MCSTRYKQNKDLLIKSLSTAPQVFNNSTEYLHIPFENPQITVRWLFSVKDEHDSFEYLTVNFTKQILMFVFYCSLMFCLFILMYFLLLRVKLVSLF